MGSANTLIPPMRYPLIPHPDSRCEAVSNIEVEVSREPSGDLLVRYRAFGNPTLFIPERPAGIAPGRGDELWLHTCFEAFVKPAGEEAYYEFNVAPSFQWAAYRFTGYRRDRRNLDVEARPEETRISGDSFELLTRMKLGRPEFTADWRLAIAAVIEEASGNISYWALRHPAGKADFHHSDGFALELPATCSP